MAKFISGRQIARRVPRQVHQSLRIFSMRKLCILFLVNAVASELSAGTWQVAAGLSKAKWGAGYAEARSDPSVLISAGVSPTRNWLIDMEVTHLKSDFRGFRPPSGEMRSWMSTIEAHRRLQLTRAASVLFSLGASGISHDRLGASTFGAAGGIAGEFDLTANLVVTVRARYHVWDGSGSIANPKLSFSTGIGYRF